MREGAGMRRKIFVGAAIGLGWVLAAPVVGIAPAQNASPTDGRIAYSAPPTGDNEEPHDIFVMNADGTDPVNLTNTPGASEAQPAWSPDGTQILYTRTVPVVGEEFESQTDIFVMDADGSAPTNVTDHPKREAFPTWAPTGDRIAFTRETDGLIVGNNDVFVMDIGDPSSATNLTNTEADEISPSWSPVGERIVFTGVRDADPDPVETHMDWEIVAIDSDGTNEQNLTAGDEARYEDWSPDWSPDGTKIVWMAQVNCCWSGDSEQWDVWAMNADGSGRSNLTQNPAGDWFPSWSSDGSGIVFSSNRATGWRFDTYTMPAPETLPLEPPSDGGPVASLFTSSALARGIPASRISTSQDISEPDWWVKLKCTVKGTSADDSLSGTDADDVICGFGGDDEIAAGDGNDVIRGGRGADTATAGPGIDIVSLDRGFDTARGGTGSDVLRGGTGGDELDSKDKTRGNDTLFGGTGIDTCLVNPRDFRDSC